MLLSTVWTALVEDIFYFINLFRPCNNGIAIISLRMCSPRPNMKFYLPLSINCMPPKAKKVLQLFRLRQINNGVFLRINKVSNSHLFFQFWLISKNRIYCKVAILSRSVESESHVNHLHQIPYILSYGVSAINFESSTKQTLGPN